MPDAHSVSISLRKSLTSLSICGSVTSDDTVCKKTVIITLFYEAALTVSGFNVIKRAESRDRCADGKAAHTVLLSQSRFGHQLLTGFIITGLKLLSENVEKLFCKPVSANYILCHMITSANVASCIIGI